MKIVHLSQTDSGAGAGRAAYRIHEGLRRAGVDSTLIVSVGNSGGEGVELATPTWLGRQRTRLSAFLEAKLSKRIRRGGGYFSPAIVGSYRPAIDLRVRQANVVCLYWINGGFVQPEGLLGIKAPIVWRLSDVWPFTGGCHYPGKCRNFCGHCGGCPQLNGSGMADRSNDLWVRKQHAWKNLDLTIAAPSQWIAGLAARSSLFGGRRIEVINTGVDVSRFRPMDRNEARSRMGLPLDRSIVLFGAMDPEGDWRKGFHQLKTALEVVAADGRFSSVLSVIFGGEAGALSHSLSVPTLSVGRIDDDEKLAMLYSAADLMIVPSLEDNLPNVALESIACGVPVVGFDACGMPEIVEHTRNGYLASGMDGVELGEGIRWMLADHDRLRRMGLNARIVAERSFDLSIQVERYRNLFEELHDKG